MNLSPSDHIVTAWAEKCSGPGWRNQLVWVLVRDGTTGAHRIEAVQQTDFEDTIWTLFPFSFQAHRDMTAAVEAMLRRAR